jgi:AraC-like DNA-binding protein
VRVVSARYVRRMLAGFRNETILAAFTRGLLMVGELAGAPREELLESAGLSEADVSDPDGRVPIEAQYRIWLEIAARSPLPIGLMMGQNFGPEMLGVVGLAARQEPTVHAAFDFLWKFRKLVGGPLMGEARIEDGRGVIGKVLPQQYSGLRHFGESFTASSLSFIRKITGREEIRPLQIRLQHAAPGDLEPLRECFGCPIEFQSHETAVELEASVLALPVRTADVGLRAYLETHAQRLLEKLPARSVTDDLPDRAFRALVEELRGGQPTADRVARKLGVGKRTLQRRLQDSGVDFSALLDKSRRELALQYLHGTELAAYEIAYLLGYTEPSAFFRAFKRWTGKTPSELRAAAA